MTIREMHKRFRTIGQAKGLQLVRAVLPESIDEYLNAAMIEKCRSVIVNNASTQIQGKLTNRDNPMSPYNALRTLFREERLTPSKNPTGEYYVVNRNHHKKEVLHYLAVAIEYGGRKNIVTDKHEVKNDVLFSESPRRYPCRIIEPDKIYYVLNDFCSAPSKEYPCCVIDSTNTPNRPIEFQFYTALNPIYQVYISWIDMPMMMVYDVKNEGNDVDCELPDYLHDEIVEMAVNKYFTSVGSTSKQVN